MGRSRRRAGHDIDYIAVSGAAAPDRPGWGAKPVPPLEPARRLRRRRDAARRRRPSLPWSSGRAAASTRWSTPPCGRRVGAAHLLYLRTAGYGGLARRARRQPAGRGAPFLDTTPPLTAVPAVGALDHSSTPRSWPRQASAGRRACPAAGPGLAGRCSGAVHATYAQPPAGAEWDAVFAGTDACPRPVLPPLPRPRASAHAAGGGLHRGRRTDAATPAATPRFGRARGRPALAPGGRAPIPTRCSAGSG